MHRRAHNNRQLKSVWNQQNPKPERQLRVFNRSGGNLKGKIKLDDRTFINYDYSSETQKTKLRKKDSDDHIDRDIFKLSKFPTLQKIISEIPATSNQLNQMDLFLMKDLGEALLWKNKEFEFHN